jgi:hypothetical protein
LWPIKALNIILKPADHVSNVAFVCERKEEKERDRKVEEFCLLGYNAVHSDENLPRLSPKYAAVYRRI